MKAYPQPPQAYPQPPRVGRPKRGSSLQTDASQTSAELRDPHSHEVILTKWPFNIGSVAILYSLLQPPEIIEGIQLVTYLICNQSFTDLFSFDARWPLAIMAHLVVTFSAHRLNMKWHRMGAGEIALEFGKESAEKIRSAHKAKIFISCLLSGFSAIALIFRNSHDSKNPPLYWSTYFPESGPLATFLKVVEIFSGGTAGFLMNVPALTLAILFFMRWLEKRREQKSQAKAARTRGSSQQNLLAQEDEPSPAPKRLDCYTLTARTAKAIALLGLTVNATIAYALMNASMALNLVPEGALKDRHLWIHTSYLAVFNFFFLAGAAYLARGRFKKLSCLKQRPWLNDVLYFNLFNLINLGSNYSYHLWFSYLNVSPGKNAVGQMIYNFVFILLASVCLRYLHHYANKPINSNAEQYYNEEEKIEKIQEETSEADSLRKATPLDPDLTQATHTVENFISTFSKTETLKKEILTAKDLAAKKQLLHEHNKTYHENGALHLTSRKQNILIKSYLITALLFGGAIAGLNGTILPLDTNFIMWEFYKHVATCGTVINAMLFFYSNARFFFDETATPTKKMPWSERVKSLDWWLTQLVRLNAIVGSIMLFTSTFKAGQNLFAFEITDSHKLAYKLSTASASLMWVSRAILTYDATTNGNKLAADVIPSMLSLRFTWPQYKTEEAKAQASEMGHCQRLFSGQDPAQETVADLEAGASAEPNLRPGFWEAWRSGVDDVWDARHSGMPAP